MLWIAYYGQLHRQHAVPSPELNDKVTAIRTHKFDFAHLAESATRKDDSKILANVRPLRVTSFDFRREIGERALATTLGKTRGKRVR